MMAMATSVTTRGDARKTDAAPASQAIISIRIVARYPPSKSALYGVVQVKFNLNVE